MVENNNGGEEMPSGYTKMRDRFFRENLKKGMSREAAMKAAKKKAAKIFNATHPNNPVGRHSD